MGILPAKDNNPDCIGARIGDRYIKVKCRWVLDYEAESKNFTIGKTYLAKRYGNGSFHDMHFYHVISDLNCKTPITVGGQIPAIFGREWELV